MKAPGSPLVFKCPDGDTYEALRDVLINRGWAEFSSQVHNLHDWNLTWRGPFGCGGSGSKLKFCTKSLQRVNHFEKSSGICKKDCLTRNLRRMQNLFRRSYTFYPPTYILPRDYRKFEADFRAKVKAGKDNLWICKPSDGCQGNDIYIIDSLDNVEYSGTVVIQKYLTNPYLIGGYKFDLRVYVLVESFRPLEVYLYREGIVRFSTEKYDLTDIDNIFSHLTNSSINKRSSTYNTNKATVGKGCKWTLTRLFSYLKEQGVNTEKLYLKIQDLVIMTLLPIVHSVPPDPSSFELFGFDIILDQNLKPWLLEVNASPSIRVSGDVDRKVKIPLLNDVLDILGWDTLSYPPEEMKASHLENRRSRRARTGINSVLTFTETKRVRTRVSSHWTRRPSPNLATSLRLKRWSSTHRAQGLRVKKHRLAADAAALDGTGVPILKCNEATWTTERIGGFEKIYPFSDKTQAAAQFIDPFGYRSHEPPFISQQFDQILIADLRERSRRFNGKNRRGGGGGTGTGTAAPGASARKKTVKGKYSSVTSRYRRHRQPEYKAKKSVNSARDSSPPGSSIPPSISLRRAVIGPRQSVSAGPIGMSRGPGVGSEQKGLPSVAATSRNAAFRSVLRPPTSNTYYMSGYVSVVI